MTTLKEFEQVAVVHMDAAYSLAYWLLRDRDDAEDVVQDAYLRAFRAFDTVRGADVKPWLLTIVRHVAYRWLSVRKRTTNVVPLDGALPGGEGDRMPELASEEPSAEDLLVGRAEQALVRRALAELPPALREVIVLRELEELSYREIAEVTGAPVGTVMSRLARGRDQLRQQLARLIAKENRNALR